MEREPTLSAFSSEDWLHSLFADYLEPKLMPLMGYGIVFIVNDPAAQRLFYNPCLIPAVPPGLYRLQAFTCIEEFRQKTPPQPISKPKSR